MQLAIEEGQTLDYIESPRDMELALTDVSDPDHDEVYGIPESRLGSAASIEVPGTPIIPRPSTDTNVIPVIDVTVFTPY